MKININKLEDFTREDSYNSSSKKSKPKVKKMKLKNP